MATHEVRVDYAKSLTEEPGTGHNRRHPGHRAGGRLRPWRRGKRIPATPSTGRWGPGDPWRRWLGPNLNVVHPHRAGVRQRGRAGRPARGRDPGGRAGPLRRTVQVPGLLLRDLFPDPYMAWLAHRGRLGHLRGPAGAAHPRHRSWAPSGCRPTGPDGADHRPRAGRHRPGGFALPPDPTDAVPSDPAIASEALRTIPPRRPPATPTSSSSARAPGSTSRCSSRAGWSPRPATPTSPRATTRPAAPLSRCA